jgi:hypothetical protein
MEIPNDKDTWELSELPLEPIHSYDAGASVWARWGDNATPLLNPALRLVKGPQHLDPELEAIRREVQLPIPKEL